MRGPLRREHAPVLMHEMAGGMCGRMVIQRRKWGYIQFGPIPGYVPKHLRHWWYSWQIRLAGATLLRDWVPDAFSTPPICGDPLGYGINR